MGATRRDRRPAPASNGGGVGGGKLAGGIVLPKAPPMVPGCTITQLDLDVLLEGAGAEAHRASRDVAIGVCATSLVGLVGVAATLPSGAMETGITGVPLLVVVLLAAAALASGGITLLLQRLMTSLPARASYSRCVERIRAALATAAPSSSPRQRPTGSDSGLLASGQRSERRPDPPA